MTGEIPPRQTSVSPRFGTMYLAQIALKKIKADTSRLAASEYPDSNPKYSDDGCQCAASQSSNNGRNIHPRVPKHWEEKGAIFAKQRRTACRIPDRGPSSFRPATNRLLFLEGS